MAMLMREMEVGYRSEMEVGYRAPWAAPQRFTKLLRR
jgi:hypothetical protein